MNQLFEQLNPYLERNMAFEAAMTLFEWDLETLAPTAGLEYTSKVIGILSDEYFKNIVNDQVKTLVDQLKRENDLSDQERAVVKELSDRLEKLKAVPPEEYKEYASLKAKSTAVWAKARKDQDYAAFAPVLEKVIFYEKRFANYRSEKGKDLYNILLSDYEKDFDIKTLDRFFGELKTYIIPLLKTVTAKNDAIDDSFLYASYDIVKQREFARFLAEYVGFDFERGILAESAHPFTTNLHNRDVRITTNYHEKNLASAIFSVIHEVGHGIYEMGIADDITQTIVGTGASMGIHESQSRFFENLIGRSKAFWKPIYGKLVALFPTQLEKVSLDEFVKGINKVRPGLIRIEADELTYCLHIMVRYEMEKMIIDGNIDIRELPGLWNDKYEEYLGVRPQNDAEGILQDIHWSQGSFGYFPSYALGTAFASQIYHHMNQEVDLNKVMESGVLKPVIEYLRTNLHQYGKTKSARELLTAVTGEDFNPHYYIEYLKEKYIRIYDIKV